MNQSVIPALKSEYPRPTLGVPLLRVQVVDCLDQVQRHVAHSEDDAEMRRMVMAGTHLAMASVLLGGDSAVSTNHALQGLQALVAQNQRGGVHEH
jgi:hypothetical protein